MEINNVTRLVPANQDGQFRLVPCGCGNDQPVYVVDTDGNWHVMCLDCFKETKGFSIKHDAQLNWNKEVAR